MPNSADRQSPQTALAQFWLREKLKQITAGDTNALIDLGQITRTLGFPIVMKILIGEPVDLDLLNLPDVIDPDI